jgi:serine/threonine-protein kinase
MVANQPLDNQDPLLNQTIMDYKFVALLGKGGFGAVYRAQHPRLKREVAVKYIKIEDPETAESVDQEIEILTRLRHPNVVEIYDAFRFADW